ncbi:unnamed protein product [Chrysoparadoxa australica]
MKAEEVAQFPLPGTSSPICLSFSPDDEYLTFLHAAEGGKMARQLWGVDLNTMEKKQVVVPPPALSDGDTEENLSLEEKLRRERARFHAVGITSYYWSGRGSSCARLLVPLRGNIYIQDGVNGSTLRLVYDAGGAVDPQMSSDGKMVAFVKDGDIYAVPIPPAHAGGQGHGTDADADSMTDEGEEPEDGAVANVAAAPVRLSYNDKEGVTNGLAGFLAEEEMDLYRGLWWSVDTKYIAFMQVDESHLPVMRIMHLGKSSVGDSSSQEDHRYPFAGKENPKVRLGVIRVDKDAIGDGTGSAHARTSCFSFMHLLCAATSVTDLASFNPGWMNTHTDACGDDSLIIANWCAMLCCSDRYLTRVNWLQDGNLCCQIQNREQSLAQLLLLDPATGGQLVLVEERSSVWTNLHHLFRCLPSPSSSPSPSKSNKGELPLFMPFTNIGHSHIAHNPCKHMPHPHLLGFSFIWASERTGFMHLYLYDCKPGDKEATLKHQITSGEWLVESVVAIDEPNDLVYITGTFDSPLERHLYAVSLSGAALENGAPRGPVRLTSAAGMHTIVMDHSLKRFVDVHSCAEHPAKASAISLPLYRSKCLMTLYHVGSNPYDPPIAIKELHDAVDERVVSLRSKGCLKPPEIFNFPSSDEAVTLYGCVYIPDPKVHGPGPYPCAVSVYGGPHVQRVHNGWNNTVDMRAQRLRDMGFVVLKCDNRGSHRRGLEFEGWIRHKMGTIEVSDQEELVKWACKRGLVMPGRVGVFGWSYGGYLSAMCLCKASSTFKVAVSGAPVTSWDGYDTHYTERYMATPQSNPEGYAAGSVLTHASKLQGKLLLVHGLIDENVHFRHTARLINALIAARKPYDLLIFPDERHSPRRVQDRVYMEQRISDYFVQYLMPQRTTPSNL